MTAEPPSLTVPLPGSDHRTSLRLLFRGIRDNDSAALLLIFFVTNDDSTMKRPTSIYVASERLPERLSAGGPARAADAGNGGNPRESLPAASEQASDPQQQSPA